MFGIFENKRKFTKVDDKFFKDVIFKLPLKYHFLRDQIMDQFILGKKVNPFGGKGSYTLLLNANLEHKYLNKSLPNFFILKDIGIWNKVRNSYEMIELDILQGMFAGYMVRSSILDLDSNLIDTSRIKEKKFLDEDKIALSKILGKLDSHILDLLDIQNVFKIEVAEGVFYMIKDLGDGNYLTINQSGAIFMMIHDPYKIEKIFDNKDSFVKSIESGDFNIQKFYESLIR